jgi:SAM-dependent MidA family methyltransferase
MHNLPQPDINAREHSALLTQMIMHNIDQSGGKITFAEFMDLALYTPGLGYYSAGKSKFGGEGDFITAPELSPLFGRCVAHCIADKNILELGAGTGKLAAELLQCCSNIEHYYILEISASLRTQQQQTILNHCPQFFSKVQWLDRLPEKFTGSILANEVMDALPATRFSWQDQQVLEYYVTHENKQLRYQHLAPSDQRITQFVCALNLPDNYSSEMHLLLKPWLKSLSDILDKGMILLFDYGFPRHELYHPDRHMGSLMCHYHHYAHADPFFYPGLQDITAHVDFTAVAEAAYENHLEISGYTTQAAFLLDCGIHQMADDFSTRNAVKILTSPNEMGELFKVMALTRGMNKPLKGFNLVNKIGTL